MTPAGFPHSDIPGSKTVCVSPRLIAAYHVLHRLLVPRHPPCTLSSLTEFSKVLQLCIPSVSYSIVNERPRQGTRPRTGHVACTARASSCRCEGRLSKYRDRYFVSRFLVEIAGLEPAASGLQSRRSPS